MAEHEIGSINLGRGVDVRDFAGALMALDSLFGEVAKEAGYGPDDVKLMVGPAYRICDGCLRRHTPESTGWMELDGLDYCPTCQHPDWASEGEGTPDA